MGASKFKKERTKMIFKRFRNLKNKEKQKYYFLIFLISLGFNLMFIGGILNQVAMHFNENRMPVLMYGGNTYTDNNFHLYYLDITEAKMYALSDIFKVGNSTYSIGDIIIWSSVLFLFIISIKLIKLSNKLKI
jgi:hypothetical protein